MQILPKGEPHKSMANVERDILSCFWRQGFHGIEGILLAAALACY